MHRNFVILVVFSALAVLLQGRAQAQATAAPVTVEIERLYLGSGEPQQAGFENATLVLNNVYHAPQYLPGMPTAASIWPRVSDVPCTRSVSGALRCKGYNWTPAMGRAEYLYFRPVLVAGSQSGAVPGEVPAAAGAVEPDPAVAVPVSAPAPEPATLGGAAADPAAKDPD